MFSVLEINMPVDEVFLRSRRKYNLDEGRPLWQKLFFRFVYLPVVRFAFNRANISAPCAMDAQGRIELIEIQGAYLEREVAEEQCEDEYDCVRPFPLHYEIPKESTRYGGHRYPRSLQPDRYRRRPPQAFVVYPQQMKQAQEAVNRLSEAAEI